jgi:hypothetical protein
MSLLRQREDGLMGGAFAMVLGALAVWVGFQMIRRPEHMTRWLTEKLGGTRLPSWLPRADPGSFLWYKRAWGFFAMLFGLFGIAVGVSLLASAVTWQSPS